LYTVSIIFVVFLILLACAEGQAYRARQFANAILSDVRKLRVGQSTYDDVSKVWANYKSRSSIEGNGCDRIQCILDFSSENKWLYDFGLVPGARFAASLTVRQGVLIKISISLTSDPHYIATTDETLADPNVSAFVVGGKRLISSPRYSYVWARITSAASPDQRQQAYAFNLTCLTKWGGCKDSNQLLPILKPLSEADGTVPSPPISP